VGTSFVAQSAMLGTPVQLGRLFDFIVYASQYRFEALGQDLEVSHLKMSLQGLFTTLIRSDEKIKLWLKNENLVRLDDFMSESKATIKKAHELHEYPEQIVHMAWAKLAAGLSSKIESLQTIKQTLHILSTFGGAMGRGQKSLFDATIAEKMIEGEF
jgi:hypothetical protein